jgi:hypothetical protein
MDEELKTSLEGMESRLVGHVRDMPTKLDLESLENRLIERMHGMQAELENHLIERMHGMQAELENHLIERMRDMQTELMRGFESFSAGQTIRLRKVEADQSNLDTSLSGRVNILEARLTQIELRLGRQM